LHHAVSNRGNRDHADLAPLLGNLSSSIRPGAVRAGAQVRGEILKELSTATRLDPLERLPVGSGGAVIAHRLQIRRFKRVEFHDVDMQSPEAVRRDGFRSMAYRRAKLLQTDRGLYHPAHASPRAPCASGRAPSLHGHCPASSLLQARPPSSRLRGPSPSGSNRYLASAGFLRGTRSPSLFPPMSLCTCRRPLPRRMARPQIGFGSACGLRRNCDGSAFGCQLTRPRLDVHASLRPVHSLTPPSGALSVGFTGGISHAGFTQAMRLRSVTASGLSPYGSTGTSRHHTIKSAALRARDQQLGLVTNGEQVA
jgi:hypothetical protein